MFATRPTRCPLCRPVASEVRHVDGSSIRGWAPEATYVGFLRTTSFEGYKRAPEQCPACGTRLVAVEGE